MPGFRRTIHFVFVFPAVPLLISFLGLPAGLAEGARDHPLIPQNQKIVGESVRAFIVQFHDGAAKCRAATREETERTIPFLIYGLNFVPDDALGNSVEVRSGGHTLTINNLGAATAAGFSASYIIVAFPPELPAGDYPLSVRIRGVFCSNSPVLSITGP